MTLTYDNTGYTSITGRAGSTTGNRQAGKGKQAEEKNRSTEETRRDMGGILS